MEPEIGSRVETRDRKVSTGRRIDPQFAAAHSGLADSYSVLGYLSYLSPAETFPEARRHATKALELDASLAEAHASLGFVKLYFDWDWSGAETEFQQGDRAQSAPRFITPMV